MGTCNWRLCKDGPVSASKRAQKYFSNYPIFGYHLLTVSESQNPGASHAISLSQFHVSWANFDYGLISSVQNLAIHGSHNLPKGYDLVSVPRHAQVERHGSISDYAEIKSKYSPVKALIAIVQLLYAIATLYESRVHQIDRFGYAAFGLTVAPYAVMSLLNLIAGLLCPEFEEIYLITSSILEEARSRPDAQFGEVAGDLVECGDGSVQVADTYMGSVVVQVDATFEFDEKAQRHSVSVAAATQSHGSTVGEKRPEVPDAAVYYTAYNRDCSSTCSKTK